MNLLKALKKHTLFPLLTSTFLDHLSLNISFPVLTLIFFSTDSRLFLPGTPHATRALLYGLCAGVAHVSSLIMTPMLSTASDQCGRKMLLILCAFGALVFALTSGFGIMAGMISLVIIGRFIGGLFSNTHPIGLAAVADMSNVKNKVVYMGYLQTTISAGACIGPLLGGYFAKRYFFTSINYAMPYLISAGLALLCILFTQAFFKETVPKPALYHNTKKLTAMQQFKHTLKLLSHKKVLKISLILTLFQLSWRTYYLYILPLTHSRFHFGATRLGIFSSLIAFWLLVATTFLIKPLRQYLSLNRIIIVSAYAMLVGMGLTLLASYMHNIFSQFLTWVAAIPVAMGDVIAYSCTVTLFSDSVSREDQGKVMGIAFIVVSLTWLISSLFGGILASFNVIIPMIFSAFAIACFIILCHSRFKKLLI